MTNNLKGRVAEHKSKTIEGFTKKYNITMLVYYEKYNTSTEAIAREKQIKGWIRKKKLELIEKQNPSWHDLSAEWF